MPDEKRLTVREVAKLLEASRATITAWCREGKFPNAQKVSGIIDYWLIPESDLKDVEIKMGRPKKQN